MVIVLEAVQLKLSVTRSVYVPAINPLAVAAEPPLGLQLYVYGEVPPVTVALAVPLAPLKQDTCVEVKVMDIGKG